MRVGIDTSGTFTDIAILDDGELEVGKVATSPAIRRRAATRVSAYTWAGGADLDYGHGTTIGTNALLQHALPRAALITTYGFRDVAEIGRQKRLGLYDLDPRTPEVPVEREFRFEVRERVDSQGRVVEPLDFGALEPIGDSHAARAPDRGPCQNDRTSSWWPLGACRPARLASCQSSG